MFSLPQVLLWPTRPTLAKLPLPLHQDSCYNTAAAMPRGQDAGGSS